MKDYLAEIEAQRVAVNAARRAAEAEAATLARLIRAAVKAGCGVTAVAHAAGLSRERIYQIRDGRR